MINACVLVPHYDHVDQFRRMLPALVEQGLPLLVVDDASPTAAFAALGLLLDELAPDALLVRRAENGGKGAAVWTGLQAAFDAGFSHALQVDADGQHDVNAVPRFVTAGSDRPAALICGRPRFDDSISPLRYYGRFLTLFLAWLQTLGRDIEDAMCGFRLYPLAATLELNALNRFNRRMGFDPEVLVRAVWAGIPLQYIDVSVRYPEQGRSHFHYLRDNAELTWMHIRLLAGMLLRLPLLLMRKVAPAASA
jgi:hypothetical protein